MKRTVISIVALMVVLTLCFGLIACDEQTLKKINSENVVNTQTDVPASTENTATEREDEPTEAGKDTSSGDQTQTGEEDQTEEEQKETVGYTVTFDADEYITVTVYPTQTLENGEQTTTALSRNGDTGEVTDTDGQVNFTISIAEGYVLDALTATPESNYKNLKSLGNNVYRITKITGDVTIEFTSKQATEQGEEQGDTEQGEEQGGTEQGEEQQTVEGVTEYTVDTTLDSETVTLAVKASGGTFTADYADGVLSLDLTATEEMTLTMSGAYAGGIVLTDSEKNNTDLDVTLSLTGVTIVSSTACPLYVDLDADLDISAKSGTENVVTDNRAAVDEDGISAAVYVTGDLTLKGKGSLTVTSQNNNGIHGKDDVSVKNLTLYVSCIDNALKGNDSVTVESGALTLIARQGDGIKTSNSSLSSSSKQKGTVTISGGTLDIYAACDGIDAAYDVVVTGGTINITTDKYSSYSEEVTAVADGTYYVRATSTSYKYSVYYFNADGSYEWVNSTTYEAVTVQSGRTRTTYYYYPVAKKSGYSNMYVYVYSSAQTQGQNSVYYAATGSLALNSSYDTIALTVSNGSARVSWTNKTTQSSGGMGGPGGFGPGGMQEGNGDKGDYSTKGIKADNEITISGGVINILSYDDAIHANNDNALENGETPKGNVTITGGEITVYSNDDGIHADGVLTVSDGSVTVDKSYEGLEGNTVVISGGTVRVAASDDGINACAESGVGLRIDGGYLYVYAGGDGLDANSKTNYQGIVFNGGKVVVVSTSGGNSCIDTEKGYTYNGGSVVAMCPTGMQQEAYNCTSTNKKYTTTSLSGYLTVSGVAVVKLPVNINNGFVICLGSSTATFSTSSSTTYTLDANGVYWFE